MRLTDSLHKKLSELAEQRDLSMQQLVTKIIRRYVYRNINRKEDADHVRT
jgi:hypothetical protein